MNKIIVLPGNFESSFFINEIEYLINYFDEVVIISYKGDEKKISKLSKEYGFRYYMVNENKIKPLFNINLLRWLFSSEVKKEIKCNLSLNINSIFILLYILFYWIYYLKAKKYLDKEINKSKSDNIYLYSFWLSRPAFTVAMYNNSDNVKKIISRAHGYDLYIERNKYNYLPFRNLIDKNLDEIHFISEDGLKYFERKFSKDKKYNSKKVVSRLGTYNKNNIRKNIIDKNYICIASCSYIKNIKRLDLIVDVISNINYNVKWIHIGDGELMEDIKKYTKKNLNDDIYNFLGEVKNNKILNLYKRYDVDYFINMSDSEGVPVSIMEAISVGLPVIARDVGGISEIVNNENGLLIKNMNNMNLVYHEINSFVKERLYEIEKYNKKSNNSYDKWKRKFNADSNYKIFFENIIDK